METAGTSVLTLVFTLATVAVAFFIYNRNVINATTAALRSQQKTTLDATARAQLVKDLLEEEAEIEKKKKKSVSNTNTHAPPSSTTDASQTKKNVKVSKKSKSKKSSARSSEVAAQSTLDDTSSSPGSSSAHSSDYEEESIEDLLLLSSLSSSRLKKSKNRTKSETPIRQEVPRVDNVPTTKPVVAAPVQSKPAPQEIKETKPQVVAPVPAIKDVPAPQSIPVKTAPKESVPAPSVPTTAAPAMESDAIRAKLESRIKTLEQQLKEANRKTEENRPNRADKIENVMAERDALANELTVLKDTNRVMTQSLVSCQHNLRESSKKIMRLEGEIEGFRPLMERAGSIEKSMEMAKHENSQLVLQVSEAQQYVKNMRSENARLQQVIINYEEASSRERAAHAASLGDANKTISALKQQINTFDAEMSSLMKSKSNESEEKMKLGERFRALTEELNKMNEEKRVLVNDCKKLQQEKTVMQNETAKVNAEKQSLSGQLETLKKQVAEGAKSQTAEKDGQITSLKKQLTDLENSKKAEIQKMATQIKDLEARVNTVASPESQQKIERLTKEVELTKTLLSKTRSDLAAAESRCKALEETKSGSNGQDTAELYEALNANYNIISYLSGSVEAKYLEIESLKSQMKSSKVASVPAKSLPVSVDQSKEVATLNQKLEQTHQELCKSIEACTGQSIIMSALYRELESLKMVEKTTAQSDLASQVKTLEAKNKELVLTLKGSMASPGQDQQMKELNLALKQKESALVSVMEEKEKLELEKNKLHKMCMDLLQKRKDAS